MRRGSFPPQLHLPYTLSVEIDEAMVEVPMPLGINLPTASPASPPEVAVARITLEPTDGVCAHIVGSPQRPAFNEDPPSGSAQSFDEQSPSTVTALTSSFTG